MRLKQNIKNKTKLEMKEYTLIVKLKGLKDKKKENRSKDY
jgi:hypothetical protein